jgi:hypothetical protein
MHPGFLSNYCPSPFVLLLFRGGAVRVRPVDRETAAAMQDRAKFGWASIIAKRRGVRAGQPGTVS